MRTLLALLFALILIVTTLQADAVKEENEQRMKAKGQLLSETGLGRKSNAGGTDARNHPTNKGSENTNTANSSSKQGTDTNDNDDDDANDSYQNYGNDSGNTHSHHLFVKTDPPVPVHH